MGGQKKWGVDEQTAGKISHLLDVERKLTQRWYLKISGQQEWFPGERAQLNDKMDAIADSIRCLMGATQ